MSEINVRWIHQVLIYDVKWIHEDFECLFVEEYSILLVCAAKDRLLKLHDVDHERDTDQQNSTRAQ